jgi:hypothetical protein
MAKIRVYRHEAGGEDFPRLCMKCGQPAECDVPQTFAWMPGWVIVLVLLFMVIGCAGLLVWLIVSFTTRKTMRIMAPMCLQHAGHWRVRKLFIWLGLLFWVVFGVSLVAFSDQIPQNAMGPIVLGAFGGMLVWFIIAGVLTNNAIRASVINDKGMELVNVHRDFADEWNNM